MALQKDTENGTDRRCEQQGSFKENENKKKTYIWNLHDT